MGKSHDTRRSQSGSRSRRLGRRKCLRKDCGRDFQAASWNQRYCGDAECAQAVRRWQAAKRQERRRASDAGKERHRTAERNRRAQKREAAAAASEFRAVSTVAKTGVEGSASGTSAESVAARPRASPKRGHAAKRKSGDQICDRPGCYAPVKWIGEEEYRQRRFCGPSCRCAVRAVEDRERKWRQRRDLGPSHAGRAGACARRE